MNIPIKFEADLPDKPNLMHATNGVVFVIRAKPIRFGPYPTVEAAQEAFKVASTQLLNPTVSWELARENGAPKL